jgi:MYXO-CTERM domain-containing protein
MVLRHVGREMQRLRGVLLGHRECFFDGVPYSPAPTMSGWGYAALTLVLFAFPLLRRRRRSATPSNRL